ncbi:MAG: glycerol-3-phosphate 1-O-acyltransferase PlsY [Clostridia bacterium]|nr:glycerol-3-phosphate 1-O-acyltransferase PlsY [Clostridia bacterium]
MTNALLIGAIGYFIGSIPFSFIVSKQLGKIDIREYGSGNSGATNVFRTLGKKAGLLAFIGDFVKGMIAAIFGLMYFDATGALICAGMAIIGHCYPVWLKFKGGKGVATSAGMIMILTPLVGVILVITQFSIIYFSKFMSLASISVAALYPILVFAFGYPPEYIAYSVFIGLFVIYRHRANLMRLLSGTESKLKL